MAEYLDIAGVQYLFEMVLKYLNGGTSIQGNRINPIICRDGRINLYNLSSSNMNVWNSFGNVVQHQVGAYKSSDFMRINLVYGNRNFYTTLFCDENRGATTGADLCKKFKTLAPVIMPGGGKINIEVAVVPNSVDPNTLFPYKGASTSSINEVSSKAVSGENTVKGNLYYRVTSAN